MHDVVGRVSVIDSSAETYETKLCTAQDFIRLATYKTLTNTFLFFPLVRRRILATHIVDVNTKT